MKLKDMAAELRKAGWRVSPPLTQANCKHPNTRGSAQCGPTGFISEWWCLDCGYRSKSESAATLEQATFMNRQPQN